MSSEKPKQPKVITQPLPGQQYKRMTTTWADPEFESNYPTLFAYLTQTTWPDGSMRQPATLTLYSDQYCLTVILNDRANVRSAFFNEASLFGALLKIEEQLADDSVEWKQKRYGDQQKDKIPF
jgi:hypothetical protein